MTAAGKPNDDVILIDVSLLAVSLGWVRDRPAVPAALVGARTVAQLRESVAAGVESLVLPPEERQMPDDASTPYTGYPERLVS